MSAWAELGLDALAEGDPGGSPHAGLAPPLLLPVLLGRPCLAFFLNRGGGVPSKWPASGRGFLHAGSA